ncbi:MAG: UPF0280 family protein [Alphaproteobacteria bacterium]
MTMPPASMPRAAMVPAQRDFYPDGRMRLRHGPIDLIIEAFGDSDARARARALDGAARRFETILDELVVELPVLRRRCLAAGLGLTGPVARAMEAAVRPFAARHFITPMAAVAGAVADEIAAVMAAQNLQKFYVNNGGDIAFGLAPGTWLTAALVAVPHSGKATGTVTLEAANPARGLATSGRHGRSFSLGIADAVTVLAKSAALADAAATLIANQVDLPGHCAIRRQPARQRDPDTDLGARLVTVGVGPLTQAECDQALERGLRLAKRFQRAGHITGAALVLGENSRLCGALPALELSHQGRCKEPADA